MLTAERTHASRMRLRSEQAELMLAAWRPRPGDTVSLIHLEVA
jgi:hypothetical protein